MSKRPHIIVTIADDHRYNAIHALGDTSLKTPCLDRLHGQATCYSRAYIPGSTHGAVCAPSRAQLHTGRTLFQTTDNLECDNRPLPTLGMLLGEAGYHTAGVGKWHNGDAGFRRSFKQGRAVFHGGMSSHFYVPNINYVPDTTGETISSSAKGHSVDLFTNGAVAAISDYAQNAEDDQPLFLYVAMTAPHDPRDTYWRYRREFQWQDMPLPEAFRPEPLFDNGELIIRDEYLAQMPRAKEEVQQTAADYAAILMHMDDGIGRIHAAAHAAGLTTENTLFIHTADHGISLGRHGLMGKQSVYDHSMRPPLLVAGPGFEKGVTDDRLCYMQDLFPTLLEAGGVNVPASNRFLSLKSSEKRRAVGSAYAKLMRMTRNDRYKLIHTHAKQKYQELYDLHEDPNECRNLLDGAGADDASHQAIVNELNDELTSWRAWAEDPCESFIKVG